jgi:manganese transport protein
MHGTRIQKTATEQTVSGIREVLAGRRGGFWSALLFAGPAVVASIAYMDPGNFAANIQAGSKFGYSLLWVVVVANVVAMLFQALSAKLGIVTGQNLAEHCRARFALPVVIAMWLISEIGAMATDLAEFLGAAIGLSLLFGITPLWGMGITGVVTYALLMLSGRGFRPLELVIGGLVAVIGLCYLAEVLIAPVNWGGAALGSVLPAIPDAEALTIAVGIVGATVMPHAIYMHSGLTQARVPVTTDRDRSKLVRFSGREVVIALSVAGLINMAMVVMAASAFHQGHSDVGEIETAYHTLTPLLGGAAAGLFLTSLIASGISSSVVGTMAGQMIMQGFVHWRIPVWARRLITMAPAFAVVWYGTNVTGALVYSQVVLSVVLPVPMIALVWLTRRRDVMGKFVNRRLVDVAAIGATAFVLALNLILVLQACGVEIPGLPAS